MDLQRSLLIGAIALLSFMLLTEWVAFKDARTAPAAEETTRLISGNGSSPASTPDLPTPDLPAEPAAELGEDLPPVPTADSDVPAEAPAIANAGRFIEIHTDSLQLAVDLEGGDIVELALPRHLAQLFRRYCWWVQLRGRRKLSFRQPQFFRAEEWQGCFNLVFRPPQTKLNHSRRSSVDQYDTYRLTNESNQSSRVVEHII